MKVMLNYSGTKGYVIFQIMVVRSPIIGVGGVNNGIFRAIFFGQIEIEMSAILTHLQRRKFALMLVCAWLFLPGTATARLGISNTASSQVLQQWQYRAGDSPVTASGKLQWLGQGAGQEWISFNVAEGVPAVDGGDFVWYRTRLPQYQWDEPVLSIGGLMLVFEVYLEDELFYRSGPLESKYSNKYEAAHWHRIDLPQDFQGKMLYLRVFSDYPDHLGMMDHSEIVVANKSDLLLFAVRQDLHQFVVGCILILIGLVAYYIWIKRKDTAALAFGLFCDSVGVYSMAYAEVRYLVWQAPLFWWYAGNFSLFLFPVGMWAFYEQVVEAPSRIVLRRIWQLHIVFALGVLVLDLLNVMPLQAATRILLVLIVIDILVIDIARFWARRQPGVAGQRSRERRIVDTGMWLMVLFGIQDILQFFKILSGDIYVFHWGVLLMVLVLAYVLERRFSETHRQLQVYSADLEESNHKLEERVAERTRDLQDKNDALEETLDELQRTQDQLVMREKMASLGNLVAGVAHEVNNPIGAVHSAADVSGRCIERLMGELEKSASWGELQINGSFQQAVTLLKDNTKLVYTASQRIASIVQSLKNFARLDEAEFQKADLHEGLDSTLTLVHHQFKDRIEVVREYGDLPQIDCAPNQLNQVFMNLLVNAAQAIEDKGTVTIRTWVDNGQANVQIVDTGKGISSEHLEHIFDPGWTTKSRGVGTGLGLSISYNIVDKHGGKLLVESMPEAGATFTVHLPIAAENGR